MMDFYLTKQRMVVLNLIFASFLFEIHSLILYDGGF